jgi:4-hydroxybenzoate polyprenyltransferase
VLSALAHPAFIVSIVGISVIYYSYSCNPLRLKRFVILAKLLIGINSLLAAGCGFILAGGNWREFPVFWLVFILVPVSLMANFIDLKDTPGDRAAGIKTLPVLIGDRNARYLIALFTLSAYGFVFVYFQSIWISFLLILACSAHLFLLFRQPYQEKPLFLLHNTLFLGLTALLLLESMLKIGH